MAKKNPIPVPVVQNIFELSRTAAAGFTLYNRFYEESDPVTAKKVAVREKF
eukprot:SAG11_NODE_11844_length_734_cov_1.232704_1_plen_51_part_00